MDSHTFATANPLKKELERQSYIKDAIDTALERGYIKISYTPVFRTLTGKVCNLRVTTFWDDPRYGVMPENVYLPVLESQHTSYKISNYVIENVAERQRDAMERQVYLVPALVHISAADFLDSDVLGHLEQTVQQNSIQRASIALRISENDAMLNPDWVSKGVKTLQQSGYCVTLESFGGEQASLTMLSDYDFQEICLDIDRITDARRAKKLLKALVYMIKSLDIHVSAAGVETKEQLKFLQSIGCEKVQGSLLGEPQSYSAFFVQVKQKDIFLETAGERVFYDKAGLENLIATSPLGLVLVNKSGIKNSFMNEPLATLLQKMGYRNFSHLLRDHTFYLGYKFRHLAEKAVFSGEREAMVGPVLDHLYVFSLLVVAKSDHDVMYRLECHDITGTQVSRDVNLNSVATKSILQVYEYIYQIDLNQETIRVLQSAIPKEEVGRVYPFAQAPLAHYIHEVDYPYYRNLFDKSYMRKHLQHTARGEFSEMLRIRQANGSYRWMAAIIISTPLPQSHRYLLCISPSCMSDTMNLPAFLQRIFGQPIKPTIPEDVELRNLWSTLMSMTKMKFYWQDAQGRFLGASKSFLDYYGVQTVDEIVGKKASELGWLINMKKHEENMQKVLHHGEIARDVVEQGIVRGNVVQLVINESPVYQQGKIIGVLGYLYGADEINTSVNHVMVNRFIDPTTGFPTATAFYGSLAHFEDNYRLNQEDYQLASLYVDYVPFQKTYGHSLAERLITVVANTVRQFFGNKASIARVRGGRFLLASNQFLMDDNMEKQLKLCDAAIRKIYEIDGHPCTLKLSYGVANRSEVREVYHLYLLVTSRLEDQMQLKWNVMLPELNMLMETYRSFFDMVQLVDPVHNRRIEILHDGTKVDGGPCWHCFGGSARCENCISSKALLTGKSAFKIEYHNGHILFFAAHAIRIQGEVYALTMIADMNKNGHALTDHPGDSFIEELIRSNQAVYSDSLSKVHNRRFYDEQIAGRLVEGMVFIDIDHFKAVNDTYGHRAGDQIIQKVASALVSSVRDTDWVARYGGDEFIVAFDQITQEAFVKRLEILRNAVNKLHFLGENFRGFQVHISIGGCYGRALADDMLLEADKMLYQSKAAGGNCLHWTKYQAKK